MCSETTLTTKPLLIDPGSGSEREGSGVFPPGNASLEKTHPLNLHSPSGSRIRAAQTTTMPGGTPAEVRSSGLTGEETSQL